MSTRSRAYNTPPKRQRVASSSSKKSMKSKPKAKKTYDLNKTMVDMGMGFPKQMKMRHRYFETFDVISTTGGMGTHLISCNGMYDPNYTGGGHQPFYFDQVSALYNHYTVLWSRATITITHGTTNSTNASCALWINDDTSVTPTYNSVVEQGSATYGVLGKNNTDTLVLTKTWDASKTFGGSVLGNDNLQGTSSSNPTEQSYYNLSLFPQDISSTLTYNCQCLVEYIAVWEELKDLQGS